jgi:hypothetical protein
MRPHRLTIVGLLEWARASASAPPKKGGGRVGRGLREGGAERLLAEGIGADRGEFKRGYVAPIVMARLHARLGETDRAFDWLEKAYAERSPALADLKVDPCALLPTKRPKV